MSAITKRIEELKTNGFHLDFEETFNDAFNIWKQIFGYGALAYFIFFIYYSVINLATTLLPIVNQPKQTLDGIITNNPGDIQIIREAMMEYYQNPAVLGVSVIVQFLMALIFPIIAGIVYMAYKYDTEGTTNIAYLFEGFNGDKFMRLVGLFLLYRVASIIGFLFLGIGFFIPLVGFTMAACFIMLNDMPTMDAIKASFSLTFKNFFTILFLLIVAYLFSFLGLLGCFVGVLFTMPIVAIMCYSIYKKSVGIEVAQEIDNIGNV